MKKSNLVLLLMPLFVLGACSTSSGGSDNTSVSSTEDYSKYMVDQNQWDEAFYNRLDRVTIKSETTYKSGDEVLATGKTTVKLGGNSGEYYCQEVDNKVDIPNHINFEVYYKFDENWIQFSRSGEDYKDKEFDIGYVPSGTDRYTMKFVDSFAGFRTQMFSQMRFDQESKSYRYDRAASYLHVWFENYFVTRIEYQAHTDYPIDAFQTSVYTFSEYNSTNANVPSTPTLVYELKEDDTYEVSLCSVHKEVPEKEVITIPATHNDKPVTSVKEDAFAYKYKIKKIVLPESIKVIGKNAFDCCHDLEEVDLGGTEEIGEGAFCYTSLKSVIIPSTVKTIGKNAFRQNYDLTSIIFSEGLETIEDGAFDECKNIEFIELPSTLKHLGEKAFVSPKITRITLPEGLETINWDALIYLTNLSTLVIGSNVTVIWPEDLEKDFRYLSVYDKVENVYVKGNLNDFSQIPLRVWNPHDLYLNDDVQVKNISISGVSEIKTCAFCYTTGIKSIEIGEGVKDIGEYAFYSLNGNDYRTNGQIESLIIGDDVETIGYCSFYGCSFKKLEIGHGVKTIDNGAFLYVRCEEYVYHGTVAEWNQIELGDNGSYWSFNNNVDIHCDDGVVTLQTSWN